MKASILSAVASVGERPPRRLKTQRRIADRLPPELARLGAGARQ
jgi:hypothetical protein